MTSGILSLKALLEFIKQQPNIPHRQLDAHIFNPFKELYMDLIKSVPEISGWYGWINDSGNKDEKYIYVGQAQSRKTASLYNRLEKELHVEYVGLWASFYGMNVVDEFAKKYTNYGTQIKRSSRKWGTTHIFWCGQQMLSDDQLNFVENKLITIYKPRANKRRPKYIQEYPSLLQNVVEDIEKNIANAT